MRYGLVGLLATFVAACTISLSCELYNGSGSAVTILIHERDTSREPETLKHDDDTEIKDWAWIKRISITAAAHTWCYDVPEEPPSAFQHFPGWGPWVKRQVRARIEPNGNIVLLTPEQKHDGPAPEQPKGFPIVPTECKI